MATVVSTLYPPQVETFMPAFPYNEAVRVYFSVSVFDSVKDIKRVHVSVVNQKTNKNALATPLGIRFYDFTANDTTADSLSVVGVDKETSRYYIDIAPDMLNADSQYQETITLDNGTTQTVNLKTWLRNQYYKVQLRFDTYADDVNTSKYNTTSTEDGASVGVSKKLSYLNTNTQYFSEWSTVCLVRPISVPTMYLTTSDFTDDSEGAPAFNRGLITIAGRLEFNYINAKGETAISQVETDKLKSFTVSVMNNAADKDIWTSETFYTQDNVDPNSFSEKINLKEATSKADVDASENGGGAYALRLDYVTVNGYTGSSIKYAFDLVDYVGDSDFQPTTYFLVDNEEGKVCLYAQNKMMPTNGAIFVSRTSNMSEFKDWEIIYACRIADLPNINDDPDNIYFYYEDKTVGSYVWYQYQIQYRTNAGAFTRAYTFEDYDSRNDTDSTENAKKVACPCFYDAFLSRGDMQLDVRYDFSVSSLKQNVSRAKFDTLGGKYPKFAENAILKYKQFSISGLISAEADANQSFLNKNKYFVATDGSTSNELYQEYLSDHNIAAQRRNDFLPSSLDIKKASFTDDGRDKIFNNDPSGYSSSSGYLPPYHETTEYDFLWEREFRETALNWLNDGEPKLFRSMTEGLMPVMLMDISLTPNKTLGRRLYSFTATAYEIADGHSVANLDALGIINIPGVGDDDIDADIPHKNYLDARLIGQQYNPVVLANNPQVPNPDIVTHYAANKIQERYQGVRGNLKPIITDGQIYLNDLKIQFTTMPHSFLTTKDSKTGEIQTYVDKNVLQDVAKTRLGYRFRLDTFGNELPDLKEIYINSRGYYQLPSAAKAYRLKQCEVDTSNGQQIIQGDRAVYDYIVNYKLINARQEIRKVTIIKTIIGQYSDIFYSDVSYGPVFRAKYSFVKTNDTAISDADKNNSSAVGDKSVFSSNNIDTYQYMDHFKGVCFDVTPYTVVKIKWYTEDDYQTIMIGETGILHILGNSPIEDIQFVGRRLSLAPDNNGYRQRNSNNYFNREPQVKEYQFVWDESCKKDVLFNTEEKPWLISTSGKEHYKNGKFDGYEYTPFHNDEDKFSTETSDGGHDNNIIGNDICWVTIADKQSDSEPVEFKSNSIGKKWRDFDDYVTDDGLTGYAYFGAIKDPQINHVYRVRGEKYIYYIDGNWYPVVGYDMVMDEDDKDKEVLPSQIIVATPSEGHVDFKGQILKAFYAPYTEELEG